MRYEWLAMGVAVMVAISGCTTDGEANPKSSPRSDATYPPEAEAELRNYTLLVDYGGWPAKQNIETVVAVGLDERPSEGILANYGRDHPGNTTVLDVLVAWAEETGTNLQWEEQAPVVRAIDGVGNPVDPRVPPWWCYRLNGASPDVSSWQNPVTENDEVEFFYGDCDGI